MESANTIVTTTKTVATATAISTVAPSLESISTAFSESFIRYLDYLAKVPGGSILLRYIKSSYKNDPIRSLFEFSLFIFALNYFLASKRKENKSDLIELSKQEVDSLISEWEPEPLVEPLSRLENWDFKSIPLVKGQNKSHITLEKPRKMEGVANMASLDFLNFTEDEDIKAEAKRYISMDGVGACGPPNFYGTQDVHIKLEDDLAKFLDAERGILYGQDFVTAGSVIPSFLKRGDLCVVDSRVNLRIQKALIVSRCNIEFYDHNDMAHLESILAEVTPVLEKQKPLCKRFIVTEGLFAETGDLVNLPKIVELKNKYKYRIFVDETYSIGTVGANGKGVCEHYGIPRSEIGITIGSLATSFASSGGFCVGVNPMIHHQRISSMAYVFSASLPPYSARASSVAIQKILENLNENGNSLVVSNLQNKVRHAYKIFEANMPTSYVEIVSSSDSPIIHVAFTSEFRKLVGFPKFYGSTKFLTSGRLPRKSNHFDEKYNLESYILQKVIDSSLVESNVLISRSKDVIFHEDLPVMKPRLLITISNGISIEEIERIASTLKHLIPRICSSINSEADVFALESELTNY